MAKKNNGASNALVQGSILAVASIISRIIGLIDVYKRQNLRRPSTSWRRCETALLPRANALSGHSGRRI